MKKLTLTFLIIFFAIMSNAVLAIDVWDPSPSIIDSEKEIKDTIIKEARIRAENNPGFRDLRPGIPKDLYLKHCEKDGSTYDICYGIQNIKFNDKNRKEYESSIGRSKRGVWLLETLILDMGPIVASDGSFFSKLNNLVVSNDDEPNIYLKMKRNFDAKYVLDYEYSERDRQLFNEGMKHDLLGVYSNGQVALRINRNKRDLWLYIEYRDVDSAKSFLEKNRPVTANLDDF